MKAVLKGNGFNCEIEVSQVKAVDEAFDGLTITLMNGFAIVYTDTNMPQTAKQLITNAFKMKMESGTLNVDFANYTQPVMIVQ